MNPLFVKGLAILLILIGIAAGVYFQIELFNNRGRFRTSIFKITFFSVGLWASVVEYSYIVVTESSKLI